MLEKRILLVEDERELREMLALGYAALATQWR